MSHAAMFLLGTLVTPLCFVVFHVVAARVAGRKVRVL